MQEADKRVQAGNDTCFFHERIKHAVGIIQHRVELIASGLPAAACETIRFRYQLSQAGEVRAPGATFQAHERAALLVDRAGQRLDLVETVAECRPRASENRIRLRPALAKFVKKFNLMTNLCLRPVAGERQTLRTIRGLDLAAANRG